MDKKNTTIGVVLLLAAFAFMFLGPKSSPPAAPAQPAPPAGASAAPAGDPAAATSGGAAAVPAAFAAVNRDSSNATVVKLGNDFIEARFTDSGGALLEVALKKYPKALGSTEPYVFNEHHAESIFAFVNYPGLDRNTRYQLVAQTATEVVYRAALPNGLEVTRRYVLSPNTADATDPYQIRHETTVRNTGAQPAPAMLVTLALGTAAPNNRDDVGQYLKTGYSTGSGQKFIARSELEASNGFLGMGSHASRPEIASGGPLVWASVQNQFFASIVSGEKPFAGLVTRRVKLIAELPQDNPHAYGIAGEAQFNVAALAAQAEAKLTASIYVGPKEYRRLANGKAFKADEDKIMDFGVFKWFSQLLLTIMTAIHGWMAGISPSWAWGFAIVLTTLSLKTVFIPFTLAASRSAKRMAKIQPELQAIREKYKDNPQKQQQATMELFKTRKINPIGGCLPILLTMPFFMGFFSMLPSAAELRFQPFLWAHDLSSTDTVAHIPLGFMTLPLNIMPILMGATMIIQMHLTPSPSVDNAQVKMMKFMPYVFALICYNFSCALSLYSFVNGLFTIGQQLVINRMKDAEEPAVTIGPGGKPTKNVTPPKKK